MLRYFIRCYLTVFFAAAVFTAFSNTASTTPEEREFMLVKDGNAVSVIVVPDNPVVSVQLGAKELQWHISQMTGAKLDIVSETKTSIPEDTRLYLGDTRKARELGLTQESFGLQEHLYMSVSDGIVFVGKDRDDHREIVYDAEKPEKLGNLPDLYDERGSADAVYDFLEQVCGVRWLTATTTGTVIPRHKTLTVKVGEVRHRASLDMRSVSRVLYDPEICMWRTGMPEWKDYYNTAWPDTGTNGGIRRNLWLLYSMRWHNGGVPMMGNHSLYGYYQRFCSKTWEDRLEKARDEGERKKILESKEKIFEGAHPEFFARGYPKHSVPPQLCYTSPSLVKQVAQDARDYYDGKKDKRNLAGYHWSLPNPFVIEPMDNSQFCKCDDCQKWLDPDQKETGFSTGLHSNYHFQFVNAVAKELKKTHPGKPILTLAYMTHAALPDKVKLEPTIHVQFCYTGSRAYYGSDIRELELMEEWVTESKTSGRDLSLWFYNTFPRESYSNSGSNGFPGFFAHNFARRLRYIHLMGFRGIVHCGWGQDVENYIGFRLMYNLNQDVNILLDEYFTGLYGAAGVPMKTMYIEMENAWSNPADRPSGKKRVGNQELSWRYLGTPERMARWQKLLDEARKLAVTDAEHNNLTLFEKSIWSYMKTGADTFNTRMNHPIPTVVVPRIPRASGDPNRVNWVGIPKTVKSWNRINSSQPSHRDLSLYLAHDEEYLYARFIDPCGDIRKLADSHSLDTLEMFFANSREIPFRQFIFYSGESQRIAAFLQGEVNWQMNIPFVDHHIRYNVRYPDNKTQEMLISIPLNELCPGGRQIKPGETIFINAVRVSPGTLTPVEERIGSGYGKDTLVPYCDLKEMDRLAELILK